MIRFVYLYIFINIFQSLDRGNLISLLWYILNMMRRYIDNWSNWDNSRFPLLEEIYFWSWAIIYFKKDIWDWKISIDFLIYIISNLTNIYSEIVIRVIRNIFYFLINHFELLEIIHHLRYHKYDDHLEYIINFLIENYIYVLWKYSLYSIMK